VILYNGATGGLGRYLTARIERARLPSHAITARLEDPTRLREELGSVRPREAVTFIHLAAMVSVPACEADPIMARRVNVDLAQKSTGAIIDWARGGQVSLRVIYVSTGHVYAPGPTGSRLSEEAPIGPRSVYARTKLEAEQALAAMCMRTSIPFVAARVFGLIAPRQAPHYVLQGLIRRVVERDLVDIPGLRFTRDYLDARDVSDNLLKLASLGDTIEWPGVINICSGAPTTIRDLLRSVIAAVAPADAASLLDGAREGPARPDDVPWLVGDQGLFVRLAGREAQQIPLTTTVRDAVNEWHRRGEGN
jgi:GDP-4-dehydro-6-deoxy-D-mannose reductase